MQMKWRSLAHAAAGTKGTCELGGYIYPMDVWLCGLNRYMSNSGRIKSCFKVVDRCMSKVCGYMEYE